MSEQKWTQEQLAAITERDCELLVSAAAGAGKTAVLVERIIRRITNEARPVDLDRLLVVTFTNAAAAEMRERIGDAIARELDENPSSLLLQRQMALLNNASITTIHSFCLNIIRNNFHKLGLDPDFRIADETEALLMKNEALEELFEERFEVEETGSPFFSLVEAYGGGHDDTALQDHVLALYNFVQSAPWPEKWLLDSAAALNIPEGSDFSVTAWGRILLKYAEIELQGALEALEGAYGLAEKAIGLEPYLLTLAEDISSVRLLQDKLGCGNIRGSHAVVSWDYISEAFSSLSFTHLSRCSKEADKLTQEKVKDIRNEVKDRLNKLRDELFNLSSEEIAEDLRKVYPIFNCLSALVIDLTERYSKKKRNGSLLDFNDLEHFCLKMLSATDDSGNIRPSETALELRQRYEEILVDEYQDSNLVQEVILGSITRKHDGQPNIFMVGDVKQSIYRFRQARPELFLEKYNSFPEEPGNAARLIQLFRNFRSRKEVLYGVNYIFRQAMSENVGELDYGDREALYPGSEFEMPGEGLTAGGPVEILLMDTSRNVSRDDFDKSDETGEVPAAESEEERPDAIQAEARLVASRINELVNGTFCVFDKRTGGFRKAEYRDMVILLRTTSGWADIFSEELALAGIPVFADAGTGYFKTVEIQTIMSLLSVIDNPRQDIPLLAVLRSPIGGFTPDKLIDIRLADSGSFYDALSRFSIQAGEGTSMKAASFMEKLSEWREKAVYMSTSELIWHLYKETGYYSYAGAMPGGQQRQANLRLLFTRARQYEDTNLKGLFSFICFIDRLKGSSGDMGSAKILGENENVVRVMSIHKSKGLEFPVVFVSGCGKRFNQQDSNKNILLHQDLGFGPDIVDLERRITYPSLPKLALRQKLRMETLSEEMRILYVALTRAREKLILTGSSGTFEGALAKWSSSLGETGEKLPVFRMSRAQNYLDWICPCIMRHRDGKTLRECAGVDENQKLCLIEDDSSWTVRVYRSDELETLEKAAAVIESTRLPSEPPAEIYAEIKRRLEWEYPYLASAAIPVKFTVSELKRRFSEVEEDGQPIFKRSPVKRPAFLEQTSEPDAAERGTILHFVMQHLDLTDTATVEAIRQQIIGMIDKELLTPHQVSYIDINKIIAFFNSAFGKRLCSSRQIRREVPFNIEIPVSELQQRLGKQGENLYGSDRTVDEKILLQGVIDCCFEEEEGLVLVDYKTDYVLGDPEKVIKARYGIQMEYYTRALELIIGKKVKEVLIYLFYNGSIIKFQE